MQSQRWTWTSWRESGQLSGRGEQARALRQCLLKMLAARACRRSLSVRSVSCQV